ncbi:MAG: hypothetical protein FD180_982 [Planctomycetota bacterium]|nr:MAG: hypothetical protein FD180_982 [Planctomycetota bacterium]
MKTFLKCTLGLFAILIFGMLGGVLYENLAKESRVGNATERVVNRAEEAAMPRGMYRVELESVQLEPSDWTRNALSDDPKDVVMTVRRGATEIYTTQLGVFRGNKTFTNKPVSFRVAYDPDRPLTLEFREVELISKGRSYSFQEAWPFSRTSMGVASSFRFNWKKEDSAPAEPERRKPEEID